jgi:hypothetical protein
LVVVEGAISGPWVDELRRFAEALGNERFSLDLSGVGYVDAQGLLLLQQLVRKSTKVTQASPYVAALLEKEARP